MINIYTIGFTNKSAEQFFQLLRDHKVKRIVDTRVNNASQLAGFSKGSDLAFFAREIGQMSYQHRLDLAPSKSLLSRYRKEEITWEEYETEYLGLLESRQVASQLNIDEMDQDCLLCSEHDPAKCHRRLLAEYIKRIRPDVNIIHLK